MSIFIGKINNKSGLRSEFYEMAFGAFAGATTQATAKILCTLKHQRSYVFISNDTDVPITIYLVHPDLDGDADVTNRLKWFKLGPSRVWNLAVGDAPNFQIDEGTKIYLAAEGGLPTQDSFSFYGQ